MERPVQRYTHHPYNRHRMHRNRTCNRSAAIRRHGAVTGLRYEGKAAPAYPVCTSMHTGVYHLPPQSVQLENCHVRVARGWGGDLFQSTCNPNQFPAHVSLRRRNHERSARPQRQGMRNTRNRVHDPGNQTVPDATVALDRSTISGAFSGKAVTLRP